jgi:hypothetical protein
VGFKTGKLQRRRRGIFVETGPNKIFKLRQERPLLRIPGIYRPDGAGDFIDSGFYKDTAPDGAIQQTRLKLEQGCDCD